MHQGYNDIAGSCGNEQAQQYKYNGKELEQSFGLNIYEMDLRQYDPATGRWVVQDPIVHHEYSPYSAFDNNPVYWSDPSGANSVRYNWDTGNYDVFGKNDDLLGSFDAEQFGNYLNNPEAFAAKFYEFSDFDENNGNGGGGGNGNGGGDQQPKNNKNYRNYKDYYQKTLKHKFLNNFTFEDAIYHYNFGKGESVTVNLNTLNFDGITVERFLKSKQFHEGYPKIVVNFLGSDYKGLRKEQGLIYGNITLVYIGDNKIMALTDQYNFEMHKAEITKRNILTFMGSMYNGAGTPYYINFQGTAIIKNK